jgi:hypothetical protein|tara:strand:+ start:2791 stop:3495 length:705 start_codon:yes stop_codon:yes gene_type:complete
VLKKNIVIRNIIFGFFLSVLFVLGCSKSYLQESGKTPSEIVQMAQLAVGDVQNFTFELEHKKGYIDLGNGLNLIDAHGYTSQNDFEILTESTLGRSLIKSDAVVIGGRTWITNPITGKWSEIPPDDSPINFLNPTILIKNILANLSDIQLIREDESVYEVSAETYSDSFESLVGSVKTGKKVKIEMKINKLSNYLEQVNINGQIQLNDEDDFERVIYFSKYNQSKILTPPTAND